MNLFPAIEPHRTGFLPVDSVHTLYYEESGNPRGTPVLFLHGGPGAGLLPYYRRLFDPTTWRIIGFDQRGCGQSTPFAEVNANSPAHLVSDIEHLRLHLGIERWHILGGSWGSTLALAYAVAHADRVLSLTLRGIFLMRQHEIDWFIHGIRTMHPDAWADFTAIIPPEIVSGRPADLLDAYLEQLLDPEPTVHMEAAHRWAGYEGVCSRLIRPPASSSTKEHRNISIARLEAYYFKHHRFSPDDWLLREAGRYRSIPGTIIHGAYDLICPPATAYDLHEAWPEAEYIIVPDAGHSALETGITRALLAATERYKHIR
jgi:proline iminopeptidase